MNAAYRLVHFVEHTWQKPRNIWVGVTVLAVSALILAAVLTPGAYAYFTSVHSEEMIISYEAVNTGAVLKGEQVCTAFDPAPVVVEMTTSDEQPPALPRAWMQTCVENFGKDATEDLEIVAILKIKNGEDFTELQRETVDVSTQPVVQPGEKQCYAYSLEAAYDPEVTYQVVAKVSVTNLHGWLPDSENCPGDEPCRKGISLSADFRVPAYATPSETPLPTPTPSVSPTETPTPIDTSQPTPTETPIVPPTETPVIPPTDTPVDPQPTQTPMLPSETPAPLEPSPTPETPAPTNTPPPQPTQIPPTLTVAPSEPPPVVESPPPPEESPTP